MYAAAVTACAVALILLLLAFRWKWRSKMPQIEPSNQAGAPPQLVHRLCPHHNVVQSFEVKEKDSLDDHLDLLTRKLAEKEGRLLLSKSKIRETQEEIDNLHAIDQNVQQKYQEIMESLRQDLLGNETDCKKLQEQIEWVSRRRAELSDEVRKGQRLYVEAAAELACSLEELQRGRHVSPQRPGDKPQRQDSSLLSVRHRKESFIPRSPIIGSPKLKAMSAESEEAVLHRLHLAT